LDPELGCLSFRGEPFPFLPDLLEVFNGTFVGAEMVNTSTRYEAVEHYSVMLPAMGTELRKRALTQFEFGRSSVRSRRGAARNRGRPDSSTRS
jgi:hypothetical protein